jgi:PhoH-like ATPase
MRIKARTLGLVAEDYFNDQALRDTDLLYTGFMPLPEDFWQTHSIQELPSKNGVISYHLQGPLCASFLINQFLFDESGAEPFYGRVRKIKDETAIVEEAIDYTASTSGVWGVRARNREQNFALNLLMDPDVDFVTLLGQAGTGKTLLALASSLSSVLEKKLYEEIIMTRATVPVGEDIGFLPGTEEEKMIPWMGALEDNLEFLQQSDGVGDWGRAVTRDLLRNRIKIKSLNFMRGRTFLHKIVIIDEAQNLTPKQMKTMITRAGPGSKIICLGNIAQIDTPYLTEASSGLTYAVDRFKGWQHNGHITLTRGERSRLADFAERML